jgi:hypothetical protein
LPLKDLLWACPACHGIETLDRAGDCRRCGARFRRGRGARIVLDRAGAPAEELDAHAWLARLPWPDLDGEGLALPPAVEPPFQERVQLRTEQRRTALRQAGDYLGRIEIFGPREQGLLELDEAVLAFRGDAGGAWTVRLEELAAVQPASSAIQLKARGGPVMSIRFPNGSVRLWEQRIKVCVRRAWSRAGRSEIVEFQPRIRTR